MWSHKHNHITIVITVKEAGMGRYYVTFTSLLIITRLYKFPTRPVELVMYWVYGELLAMVHRLYGDVN